MNRRQRFGWVPIYALLLAWQVWRLLLTPHGVPSTWAWGDLSTAALGGGAVTQEIRMGADGFDGLWVRVVAQPSTRRPGDPAQGHLVIGLAEVIGDGRSVPMQRLVLDAADVHPGPRHIPLREVRDSRGRVYRLSFQHVGAGSGQVLSLSARHTDTHPAGRMVVDGLEQWGDLVFAATARRATLAFWKDEVLAPWPEWLRSWAVVVAVLLTFNVLLALACRASWLSAAGAPRLPAVPGVAKASATAAALLVVVGGLVTAAWPVSPLREVHLANHLDAAAIETAAPTLRSGVSVQRLAFGGQVMVGLIALPPSRLAWDVHVPTGALLESFVAMRPDVWDKPSDGARLRVTVVGADGRVTEVAHFTLVPFIMPEHRALHAMRVSLDPWKGQRVTIVLETDPERWGNAVNDVPVWVMPRVTWPRGPAWGETRVEHRADAGARTLVAR